MDLRDTLNDTLVTLFNQIMSVEEKVLITDEFRDISVNDMHILEAIGIGDSRNMGAVAASLSVTTGTLTITVNSLVKKGYVDRIRSQKDKRVVFLHLTAKGKNAYEHHKAFHSQLTNTITEHLSEQELEILIRALKSIPVEV